MGKWEEIVLNVRRWSDCYSRRDLYSSHIEEIIRSDNFFHHRVERERCDETDRSNASSIIIIDGCTYGCAHAHTHTHFMQEVSSTSHCWIDQWVLTLFSFDSILFWCVSYVHAIPWRCFQAMMTMPSVPCVFIIFSVYIERAVVLRVAGRQADWRRTIVYR